MSEGVALEVQARWEQHAKTTAREVWPALKAAGFTAPALFDAIEDLDRFALVVELETIIKRIATGAEQISFLRLVKDSGTFAAQRRRVTLRTLREGPHAREVPVAPIFSERELLSINKMKPAATVYPFATNRKQRTKDEERKILVHKIGEIVMRCGFPAATLVLSSAAPDRILGRFGAGKRLGTLKSKVRVFGLMEKWMTAVYSKPFPSEIVELTDYLLDRAEEPCGPSIPRSVSSTVSFFEEIGGIKPAKRIGNDSAIISIINELKLELSANKPRCRRTANQLPIAFVVSWEVVVCDSTVYDTQRIRVWVKLVKLWCAFRTADQSGIPSKLMSFDGLELRGKILISKTTGTGKSVGEMHFALTTDAWLICPDWLSVGWRLFEATITDREFLIPLPTKDYQAFSEKEPGYSQWLTADRKLMAETTVVIREEHEDLGIDCWTSGAKPLLIKGSQMFWAGHSDRATVPTWAASLKISKERIDDVGRWRPGDSADYKRTSVAIAMGVQREVAEKVRTAGGQDVCHESGLFRDLAIYCKDRGADQAEVEEMILRLREGRDVLQSPEDPIDLDWPHDIDAGNVSGIEVDVTEPAGGWPILSEGKRVISISRASGSSRTLHVVGRCWRRPGVHFRDFVFLDEGERGQYSALCKECFPKQKDPILETATDSDSESSSDESSSSDN